MRAVLSLLLLATLFLGGCGELVDENLVRNTRIELVDWHIAGLWVINSPVAWVRVTNANAVPIHDITFEYKTYDINGKALDRGTFTIEGTVPAGQSKNFIELYIGLVDLVSERLTIRLLSVKEVT